MFITTFDGNYAAVTLRHFLHHGKSRRIASRYEKTAARAFVSMLRQGRNMGHTWERQHDAGGPSSAA